MTDNRLVTNLHLRVRYSSIYQAFFSLAQATFKSPSHIRYGQDYYDDRMQAIRRTTYEPNHDNHMRLDISLKRKEDEEEEQDKKPEEEKTEQSQLPTPPATPLHHEENEPEEHPDVPEDTPNVDVDEQKDKQDTKPKKPTDPLHWYGILVPTQLRQAQTSFVTAIQGPVIHAANAANAMRRLDVDIRRLRKDIKKAEKKSLTDKAVEA